MAKSFSINKAIGEAFRQYCKHWMVLTLGGALVSAVWLVDFNSVGHLSEVRYFVKQELPNSASAQEAWGKLNEFVVSISQRHNPLKGQFLGLLMWLVALYFHIGLVRLCMNAAGKGKAGLDSFITQPNEFARYLGGMAILVLLALTFNISLGAVAIALNWFQLSEPFMVLVVTVLAAVFLVYMLHFIFISYCLVDKAKSVMGMLSCSKNVVCGVLPHLLGFVVIFWMVRMLAKMLLGLLLSPLGGLVPVAGFDCFLIGCVIAPITAMAYTSVYRQLK